MFPEMKMGVPKPEKDEHISLDGMRAAITRSSRDSALIRNAMMAADYNGMSGEDRYTLLAYHALRSLEDLYRQHMHLVSITPMPSVFVVEPDSAEGATK